jgi:hypothetical protein
MRKRKMMDTLSTQCKKCGHFNKPTATNCAYCGAKFSRALDDSRRPTALSKPKQLDTTSAGKRASTGNSGSVLHEVLMWLLLVIALAILVGLMASAMSISWQDALYFLAFTLSIALVVALGRAFVQQATARPMDDSWPELAQSSGLTYEPDERSLLGTRYPGMHGEYHGRKLLMTFALEETYTDDVSPHAYPRFTLDIDNRAEIQFSIRSKDIFARASLLDAIASGNEDFNRLFVVKGKPGNYVKRAVEHISATGFHTLDCLLRDVRYVELKESQLVWSQVGALEIEDQIALFNLLCNLAELAELAEKMGSESARPDTRRH